MLKDAMYRMCLKLNQFIRNISDFVTLISFRDKKAQVTGSIIKSSLQIVCKSIIKDRFCGGIAVLFSVCILLLLLGAGFINVLLRFPFCFNIFYIFGLLALLFVFLKIILFPFISLLNVEKIAILIEQKYPSLNNSLISSIQLAKDKILFRTNRNKSGKTHIEYSEQLISMLITDTADRLKNLDLNRVVNNKLLRIGCAILSISLFIAGIVCLFNRSYINENIPLLISFLSNEKGIGTKVLSAYPGPAIGDITTGYRYPLYTGLQTKTLYNSTGDIQALKGSEVQISAIASRTLSSAGIVLKDSTRIPFVVENGKMLKGVLLLLENDTYVFETVDTNGRIFKDTVIHTIHIEQDRFPEVTLDAPAKDITVNEKDTVEIKYTAKDDFSVSEISLVFEHGGEKKTKPLASFSKRQLQYNGVYSWSLTELNLQPDDKIAYHIEVKDNDAISGPKVSSSKTYYLEIYSSRKKHQELVQMQEALLQEMLYLLSDDLTKRIDDEKCLSRDYLIMAQDGIQVRVERIINLFTDILIGIQDDAMANYSVFYSLENLKNKFRDVTEKKRNAIQQSIGDISGDPIPAEVLSGLQKYQDEEIVVIEDTIIFLNELIQKQKLDDVIDTGKNLIQSQNNIDKLLEKLREGADAYINEKVLSELKRIEEAIQQMMEKLMQMAQTEHMDEFLNADAFKQIEQQAIIKELDTMRDAFNKGDMDAALKAAQSLLAALQGMMNQMKSSAQNMADSSFNNMLKDTNQLLDKISELENKQRELTKNTDKLKKDIQQRTSESMNDAFKSFFERQQKRLEVIKEDLSETRDLLAKNELIQEYIRVNRDLKRMAEERDMMASRLSELFGSEEDVEQFEKESGKLSELFGQNAELNKEINRDPMQRDFLNISRELPQTEETLSHLEEMLNGWDIKESLNLSKEMSQNLNKWNSRLQHIIEQKKSEIDEKDLNMAKKVEEAADLNQHIIKDLDAMMQMLEQQQTDSLTQEDHNNLQKYAEKQKEIQEETEELTEMADKMSEQNPFMDENASKQLDMASMSMGEAKKKLDKLDVQGAVIDERESMYRLSEARKGMESAKERIAKGMMGDGISMPMPMPFRGRMDEGQLGVSTERVEIPSEEAYKVPKEFRQDILDAMKEGLPEKYKDLNKDYYQRLVD